MNRTIKLTSSLLAAALLAALPAGCSFSSGSSSSAFAGGSSGEDAPTLVFMTNDATNPNFEPYLNEVMQKTGVQIEAIAPPTAQNDMVSKFTTLLASGDDSVDLVYLNDELIMAFSRAGYLAPLEEQVMTPEVIQHFPAQFVEDMINYEGHLYSVPAFIALQSLWINQELLNANGLEAPTNQEEFLAVAKALTKDGVYGYGGSWEKSFVYNEIGTFINLFGGDYFDWHNPKTRQAVEFMYNMAHEYGVTPVAQLADNYDVTRQKMIDGAYGMILMPTSSIKSFADAGAFDPEKIYLSPMPTFETNDAFINCWHFCLNASSNNKEAAYKVLSYFASAEGQLAHSTQVSGNVPARLDVVNDPSFDALGIDVIRYYLENSNLRGRPLVPQSMELINSIGSLFQQYISDEISLDELCTQAQAEIERLK